MSNLCNAVKKDGKPCAFKRAEGLTTCKRHIVKEVISSKKKVEQFKCNNCSKIFQHKKNLVYHQENNVCKKVETKVEVDKIKQEEFRCECSQVFTSKKNLLRHKSNGICVSNRKVDTTTVSVINKLKSNTRLILAKSNDELIPFDYNFEKDLCNSLTKECLNNPAVNLGTFFKSQLHNRFSATDDKYSFNLKFNDKIVTHRIDTIICNLFKIVLKNLEQMEISAMNKIEVFHSQDTRRGLAFNSRNNLYLNNKWSRHDESIDRLYHTEKYMKALNEYNEIKRVKEMIETVIKLGEFSMIVNTYTSRTKEIEYKDKDMGNVHVKDSLKIIDNDPFNFHKTISKCVIEEEIPCLEELNSDTVSINNEVREYNSNDKLRAEKQVKELKHKQILDQLKMLQEEKDILSKEIYKFKSSFGNMATNQLRYKLKMMGDNRLDILEEEINTIDLSIKEANKILERL